MSFGKGGSRISGPIENRVFVGNLPWQARWQELKDHMRQVGEVTFAEVLEEEDGRSKGCGLVAYRTAAEAERAVTELHDSDFQGRKLLVREDRASSGPGAERQGCRVYVGNLAFEVTWKELKDHFRQVGEVIRADVMCEGNVEGGRSKGYGIVEYKTPEEAEQAIGLTDTEIFGRKIFVREDRESRRPQPNWAPTPSYGYKGDYFSQGKGKGWSKGDYSYDAGHHYAPPYSPYLTGGTWAPKGKGKGGGRFTKVFVGNLPFAAAEDDITAHMRSVGQVVSVELMTEGGQAGGRSKGSAIVEFATYGAAQRALDQLHDSTLLDRMILVREYVDYSNFEGKGGKKDRHRVDVSNVGPGVDWKDLKDHMRAAGTVEFVGLNGSVGFASYGSLEEAQKAKNLLDGSSLGGQAISISEPKRTAGGPPFMR